MLPALAALIASTSVPTSSATSAIICTRPWNRSLRATKSVSELTSTTTPFVPFTRDADQAFGGDAAGLLGGLRQALLAQPVDRRLHVAVGLAERGLAIHHARAGRVAQLFDHLCGDVCHRPHSVPVRLRARGRQRRRAAALGRLSSLRLGDPAVDAAGQSDLFADLVRRLGAELGDLPVVEDAEVVELLLDRRRHAGELLEVVGDAARPGQRLEAEAFSAGAVGTSSTIGFAAAPMSTPMSPCAREMPSIAARGDQVAVERDRAAGVVVARHRRR